MADVSPLGRLQRENDQTDRGQLLVLTGLVLAVTLVILAVLLNSVIYAENLGTRGSDIGGDEPIKMEKSLTDAAEDFMIATNQNADSQDTGTELSNDFEDEIGEWYEQANQHLVRDGDYSVVSVETFAGSQIHQTDSATFQSADGENEWTLVDDARVRDYVVKIDTVHQNEPFRIIVADDDENGDEWTLEIDSDGSTTTVTAVDENGNTEEYETSEDEVAIDFSTATINGDSSDAAVFAEGLESGYTITYENADEVEGEYRLIVDDSDVDDSDHFHETTDESPYAISAVYAAEIEFRYEGSQVEYASTIHIAPEEL